MKDKTALNFIDDFKKLLEENDTQQRRVNALAGEESQLNESIAKLTQDAEELKQRMVKEEEQAKERIRACKENADRVFMQEQRRIDTLSADLDRRQAIIAETEPKLRQRQAELDQKEVSLLAFGKKVKHLEIEVKEAQGQADRQKEENDIAQARIDRKTALLDRENDDLRLSRDDLNASLHVYKDGCVELQRKEKEIAAARCKLDADIAAFKAEKCSLDAVYADIAKKQKDIERQSVMLDEKLKNNNDKEKSLNAMKIELDYRIAQIERAKGKSNG